MALKVERRQEGFFIVDGARTVAGPFDLENGNVPTGVLDGVIQQGYSQEEVASMLDDFARRNEAPDFESMETTERVRSIALQILRAVRYIYVLEDDQLYRYNDGVYVPVNENEIAMAVQQIYDRANNYIVSEVIGQVKRRASVHRPKDEWHRIAVKNGVIDVMTGEFLPHDPERPVFNALPVVYNPQARAPRFLEFLNKVQPDRRVQFMLIQFLAFALDRRPQRIKALINVGEKYTGKSTFVNAVEALFGERNISHVKLQSLMDARERYSIAELRGKMLNVYDDLPDLDLFEMGDFKVVTGGGTVQAREIYKRPIEFKPYAKLIFNCNTLPLPPRKADDAFFSRWIVVEWNNPIPKIERDPNFIEKLTTEEELSGIFNMLLWVAKRMIEKGKFLVDVETENIEMLWLSNSEPSFDFFSNLAEGEGRIAAGELQEKYAQWCAQNGVRPVSEKRFASLLRMRFPQVKSVKSNKKHWEGIKWVGEGGSLAPSRVELAFEGDLSIVDEFFRTFGSEPEAGVAEEAKAPSAPSPAPALPRAGDAAKAEAAPSKGEPEGGARLTGSATTGAMQHESARPSPEAEPKEEPPAAPDGSTTSSAPLMPQAMSEPKPASPVVLKPNEVTPWDRLSDARDPDGFFTCPDHEFRTRSAEDWTMHKHDFHGWRLDIMDHVTLGKLAHEEAQKLGAEKVQGERVFECAKCGFSTSDRDEFMKHMEVHKAH